MFGKTNVKVKPNEKINYVEYVESTGTQYIDTEVIPTSKTKWEYDYQFLSNTPSGTGDSAQNGCGIGDNTKRFFISYNGTKFITAIGVNGATQATGDTNRHVFVLDAPNKKGYVDNTVISCAYSSISATDSICFFTRNEERATSNFRHSGRLYGSKIYEDGVLIRDFRPAVNEGTYCLYDKVSKTYFYSATTTELGGG